ncbi:MAG TPA: phosphotransferase [Bdellovibrionales bacterium]|nr:phosphotransferase [Bdellovibrionales bacterium]
MTPVPPEALKSFEPFVNRVLGRKDFEIMQLAGDASARRYYRVVAGSDSWVLMVWEPFKNDGSYPFLSVRDHFAKHGVAVPTVAGLSPDEGLVLLEDLGDLTLERKFWENQSQQASLPFYKQTIDELVKMHYPSTADRTDCTAFKMEFDVEKLLWEMNYGRDHLIVGLCGIKLSDVEKKELERVYTSICTTLHNEPKYIAHRDYHSRNVMIKLGKVRIIDFQDARLGAVQYDLVSLLRDSYVSMEDAVARELIGYYLDRRREFSKDDPSLEHFMRIYEIQTIQRCFKACGSFSSFFNLRNDTRYLKYIAHTLQTVKKSLLPFAEYRSFYNVLNDHGIFEKKFEAK